MKTADEAERHAVALQMAVAANAMTQKFKLCAAESGKTWIFHMALYIAPRQVARCLCNHFYESKGPVTEHDGGSWPTGQRSGAADPDAGTMRQPVIRVDGRSLSGLRPGDPSRCSALGG